jgi:glycosyltransferase involved in cell wall biosynthesis
VERGSDHAIRRTARDLAISAIILTQDESRNIGRCLRTMERVRDLIIVDSGSRDDTLERARVVRPDVRIYTHAFVDFGDQRTWALDNTEPRFQWVLFVDADEFCTPEFLEEVGAFVSNPMNYVGAYVAGRNYFLGRWLRYSSLYPSYQLRLLHRDYVRFRKEGHGQREVSDGPFTYLHQGWTHEPFSKGVERWIDRHNRYSTEEVANLASLRAAPLRLGELITGDAVARRRSLRILGAKVPGRPLWRFVYAYLLRLAFWTARRVSSIVPCCLLIPYTYRQSMWRPRMSAGLTAG